MANKEYNWDAADFFETLTARNKLARQCGFKFCRVNGLQGFEEALQRMQNTPAMVCCSDISQGYTSIDNSPRTRRVKTIFLAMRHRVDDMEARQDRFATLRELFRQFMSILIKERTKLEEHYIEIDRRISFNEIDEYFFSGCACAHFSVAVDIHTDLRYNSDEWLD